METRSTTYTMDLALTANTVCPAVARPEHRAAEGWLPRQTMWPGFRRDWTIQDRIFGTVKTANRSLRKHTLVGSAGLHSILSRKPCGMRTAATEARACAAVGA